jgi:hypothetical protein
MGRKTIGIGALTVVLASSGTVGAQGVSLTVRTFNNYGVSADDLLVARTHADAIFRDADINLTWVDCWFRDKEPANASRQCHQPLASNEITLRLHATNPAETRFVSMGFSLVSVEDGAPFLSTVFVDRVVLVAKSANTDFRMLLGRAIAHEIGHLLLNTNVHAERGLMRADWSRGELRNNQDADWTFRRGESVTMLAAAERRNVR